MDPYDVIGELMMAASKDWEADLLEDLCVRAGFYWKCERPAGCGWVNCAEDTTCCGCGAAKIVVRD
jgi:hypothetical protein